MASVHYVGVEPHDVGAELARWTLQGRLDWREWDGELVVRSDDSAVTYLVSPLAGETLKALRDGASHLDEIATRVFSDLTPPSAATAALVAAFADTRANAQSLLEVLAELEAQGLVRASLA